MSTESMTSNERVWTAIRLGKPDRVPVIPGLQSPAAAGLTGLSQAEVAHDNNAAVDAFFRIFEDTGGWDNPFPTGATPMQLQATGDHPMKLRLPGRDLPDDQPFQLDEQEFLKPEDYDTIYEGGFEKFYYDDFLWRIGDLTPDQLPGMIKNLKASGERFTATCARQGVQPFFTAARSHPFFMLSMMRSMVPFTADLYYNPEPVERAIKRMTADVISKQIPLIKASGTNLWLVTEERASAYFVSPAIFERFWWPYTRQIVEACWSEGIVTLFHIDMFWDKNLPYFRQLPKGSAILEFDSTTNIFKAKEALRGHLCLHGDVPAALLSLGKPEEVAAYCKRLIDEVGGDGGFILGSGCSVPPDAKRENFHAMIETAKSYKRS